MLDFFKVFFVEEPKVGLCAFELEKRNIDELHANFFNHFENAKIFTSNYERNILLF